MMSQGLKSMLLFALALGAITSIGCDKGSKGGGGNSQPDAVDRAVGGVKQSVNNVVVEADLKDIHLFIENSRTASGQMPTAAQVYEALKQGSPKVAKLVESNAIVLNPNLQAEGVWAASGTCWSPTGGFICSAQGVERANQEKIQQLWK